MGEMDRRLSRPFTRLKAYTNDDALCTTIHTPITRTATPNHAFGCIAEALLRQDYSPEISVLRLIVLDTFSLLFATNINARELALLVSWGWNHASHRHPPKRRTPRTV